ncbi:hypothetical protein [Vibrio phage nt-1]|uniref:Uncharacterized protein n=1 Tax=Vibrio phage nt-1 TaxID=115992 RepID=A0A068J6P8_9CAUD|nr:hypothetical protein [Vibrio phage nt-1]AIE13775.1 hypothetical protein [Vibrio phage nt-1]
MRSLPFTLFRVCSIFFAGMAMERFMHTDSVPSLAILAPIVVLVCFGIGITIDLADKK